MKQAPIPSHPSKDDIFREGLLDSSSLLSFHIINETKTMQIEQEHPNNVQLMTAQEVADLLRISLRTLWRLQSAGTLPKGIHLGRSIRWRQQEIQSWIAKGCPGKSS